MSLDELVRKAARDLAEARWPVALTGAGVSTESGIPDFRGPQGLWRKYDPNEFTFSSFMENPSRYWRRHLEVFAGLGDVRPNPSHQALARLEEIGRLKCVITQNVDGLHQKAGSRNVVEFHGSLSQVKCLRCGSLYPMEGVEARVKAGEIPPKCGCGGTLKPNVVFFEEPIPFEALSKAHAEALKCDLMLVAGTSASVYPAAELPYIAKFGRSPLQLPGLGLEIVPLKEPAKIVEVNLNPTQLTDTIADYSLMGKTGEILPKIVEEVEKLLGR
jgi:NAD-dependent deacetylase